MNKSFTLIEVLIAVSIIAIVVTAFLNINEESRFLIDKNLKKLQISHISSLVLLNTDKNDDKKKIYLDDLAKSFDLKDDLRRFLKSKKAVLSYDLYKTIGDEENSSENNATLLNIYKQQVNIDGKTISIYRIDLP